MNEQLGLSSFIELEHTMAQIKITPTYSVKAWNKRFTTFQDYLPRCLWVARAKRGEWPEASDKQREQEILNVALYQQLT